MKEKNKKRKIEAAAAIVIVVLTIYLLGSVPVMIADPGLDETETIYVSDVTITLTATDPLPGTGVAQTFYAFGSVAPADPSDSALIPYSGAITVSSSNEGEHTIHYYSVDNVGNVEWPCKSTTFKIGEADTTPPVTSCSVDGDQQLIIL